MSASGKSVLYQKLPSTDELLRRPDLQALVENDGHAAVAESIREVLARLRQEISADQIDDKSLPLALEGLSSAVERQVRRSLSYSLLPLINATGVILHTNLGRAPLSAAALEHARGTASAYSNLEFDLATGERGKRDMHVDRLFRKIFSEGSASVQDGLSTIVVNNNA
ncbi:MAG: hypothetical protein WAK29_13800, partial [Terriglobales bacterium]